MYYINFDISVVAIELCQTLLTTIRREANTNNHTTAIIEIKLEQSEFLPQSTRSTTKRNKKQHKLKPFDLDNHMKTVYSSEDQLITKDNDDTPQLLLININRYDDNDRNINNQQIEFSDTITVPTANDVQLQYKLIGYVLFNGDKRSGHYRVICRGEHEYWYMYNDEDTTELNVKQRANEFYKRQVVLLLYAEEQYYNDETVECDGAI